MNGNEVIKKLQAAGWKLDRINGSHHMLKKGSVTVPVPVPGHHDLGLGLLQTLEQSTGVKLI